MNEYKRLLILQAALNNLKEGDIPMRLKHIDTYIEKRLLEIEAEMKIE